MARRTSFALDSSAEALEAAAHPDGVLRGLAARRAFTSITKIQAACRGYISRCKFATEFKTISKRTSNVTPESDPPQPSVNVPSGELPPVVISTPPAAHEGPEHTLVYLAIEIKSTKKENVLLERQITNVATEIGHREARANTLQSLVTSLESSIPSDYVSVAALEKLQEQVDEGDRELEGWIAREAARKGKLIQLRSQVHAKAKLQAQWHRSRSAMLDHHSNLEAEQMMRESIARASLYIAAACREKRKAPAPLPRDTKSKTRIQLNRSKSPYAPVKKPPSRNPSLKSHSSIVVSGAKRAARITGPPPSSFPSESGLQNETPLGDDAKAMFNPKRRTRPMSVVVPEQNREEMNSRLADFYAPRPKPPSAPVAVVRKAQSTPPSAIVFDDIPNSVFGDTGVKLDLDLKLPTVPVQCSGPTLPSSRPASPATPKSHSADHRPAVSSPLARRLSKRATRHSTPPVRTALPVLAPLSLVSPEPIRIPPAKISPPAKATTSRHSPLRSSFLSSLRGSTPPPRQAPSASPPTPKSDKAPTTNDLPVPDWLNDMLSPLQNPRRSPSSGNYSELVLDLRIPSYAPNSTTPPAEREEWDIVNTSPFADRDSFQLTSQEPTVANNVSSPTARNTSETAENRRIAKLRNRASYILPRPRRGSTQPMAHTTKSEAEINSHHHPVTPGPAPAAASGANHNEVKATGGSKWRKRLSLSAILPHRS